MEIKGALTMVQIREEGEARLACPTCEMRSYKAGGLLRCTEWKRFKAITCCSKYIGPHASCHFKIKGGLDWHDTLAHAGIRR